MAELANAPDCFSGGDSRKCTLEVRILPLQPIYYMDIGEIALHLLLWILCSALVYLWFLSSCIMPAGMNMIDLNKISNLEYTLEEPPR